jgi:hypothetical protein
MEHMYLFFIRAFNDVDHLTPIVWKMSNDKHPVAVYCMNPEYDIRNDYRLDFLEQLGVPVAYIYDAFDRDLGALHRVLRFLFQRSFALQSGSSADSRSPLSSFSNPLRRLARETGVLLYKLTRRMYYDSNWARSILERTGAQALCFDWVGPERYVVKVLLEAAKDKGVPTLALPHGVNLYTNESAKSDLPASKVREKYRRYDRIVVQNSLAKDFIVNSGIESERVLVLGSARYCDEWMEQNKKILPRVMSPKGENTDKLKVVFMTTRPRYRVDAERMLETCGMLSKLSGVEVLVKPHTRTGKDAGIYRDLPLPNVADVSSVELCEWADVMLVVASSILIETLKQGKPTLYLKYLHENTTEYEDFGACWTIHDETELQDALRSLRESKEKVPYRDEDVDRWLSEIIYGGRGQRDELKDYEEFIVSSADQSDAPDVR